ncbi:T9SS type A sorting domain-containing protein [Bacteroidota bacterium]
MKKILLPLIAFLFLSVMIYSTSYSQAPRKMVFENWTSSTCPPCASNNPQLRAWIASHWDNLVCVSYHVGWPSPGNDPMYLYNPTQSYDRRYYYGVNSVPAGYTQGISYVVGSPFPFSSMSDLYNFYTAQSIGTRVIVTDTRIPPDSNKVNISVTNFTSLPTGNYYLRVMVVEHWIVYQSPPGTNGETIFSNVFRRSLPTSLGTALPTTAGTHNYEFRYKIDPVWQDTSIYTMAFIQNDVTHEILTAGRQGMVTGITPNTNEMPSNYSLSQNYPNPFNPTTNISFNLPRDGAVSLKLYDIIGNEVKTLVEGKHNAGVYDIFVDGSDLSSGVYFYRLVAGDFTATKKMILTK